MTVPASVLTDEITMDFADAVRTAADAGLGYVDVRGVWGASCTPCPGRAGRRCSPSSTITASS